MGSKEITFLSLEEVMACGGADVPRAATEIAKGFQLFDRGRVLQPAKTTLKPFSAHSETRAGLVNCLPAYIQLDDAEVFSCKMLGAMPSNVEIGLPRATGLITLFDGDTKSPLCIMDAQAISATRTGAVSCLAAQKLADPLTECIGLIGAGVNMRTQLLAMKHALPRLRSVDVYSRGESKRLFAEEMGERLGITINAVDSPEKAVRGKELFITCVANVTEPIVKAEWAKEEGLTVFNIGCFESETQLLKRMDRVVADLWEQGKHRGVQTHAKAVFDGTIDEAMIEDLKPILLGQRPGRTSRQENIFFCPTGLGFEDALVAWNVYQEAQRRGLGQQVTLWQDTKWI